MRHALLLCILAVAASAPLRADTPAAADPLVLLQQSAAALQKRADHCAALSCATCDCAAMAQKMQALIDAETAALALHRALIGQEALLHAHYNDAFSDNELTGLLLAQLQTSLAYQEFFHKLGSYILKITSIANTAQNLADGKISFTDDTSALETVEQLDSLAGLLKNAGEIAEDEKSFLETGSVPPASDPRKIANLAWDLKSVAVDIAKTARDARNAYKTAVSAAKYYPKLNQGAAGVRQALQTAQFRNGLNAIARCLKVYSEAKLKAEKELEKEMLAYEKPEAAVITAAYRDWQQARARMWAAEESLAAIRAARVSLDAAMAQTGCGAATLTRTPLGPFGDDREIYGKALQALDPMIPKLAARLQGDIPLNDPDATPAPMPPSKHAAGHQCGRCSALEPELARTLDQMDFTGQELHRIRQDLEQADDLDKYAAINRDAIKRITDLMREFRDGKKEKNALLQAGAALFRKLGSPQNEINLVTLAREKRKRQNELHSQEAKIASMRSEQERIKPLEAEQMRLLNASQALQVRIAACGSEVPADLTGTWTDRNDCGNYEFSQSGGQLTLSHAGYIFSGTVKGDHIDLFHILTYGETSPGLPPEVRELVKGEKVEISGDTSADCRGIDAVFIKNHDHWKMKEGKYWIDKEDVKRKKLRLRKVPKTE